MFLQLKPQIIGEQRPQGQSPQSSETGKIPGHRFNYLTRATLFPKIKIMFEEKPLPRCKSMLLCDRCMVEPSTEKPSVIGIFHEIMFRRFPAEAPPFTIFLELVEGVGPYELFLEVHDLQRDEKVAATPVTKFQ